jgi:hypothetical protein
LQDAAGRFGLFAFWALREWMERPPAGTALPEPGCPRWRSRWVLGESLARGPPGAFACAARLTRPYLRPTLGHPQLNSLATRPGKAPMFAPDTDSPPWPAGPLARSPSSARSTAPTCGCPPRARTSGPGCSPPPARAWTCSSPARSGRPSGWASRCGPPPSRTTPSASRGWPGSRPSAPGPGWSVASSSPDRAGRLPGPAS